MGTLKERDLNKIHDGSKIIYSYTNIAYTIKDSKRNDIFVSTNSYVENGCCTNVVYNKTSGLGSNNEEWMFVKYHLSSFPLSYRKIKLIKEWINFINETFSFVDVKILYHDKESLLDKDYWKSQKISFEFLEGHVYFAIVKKKTGTNSEARKYHNLFVLSLVRYFANNEYYFMIYDTLRLRKLKSLQHLNNWEIMNIAKFAVQINSKDHSSDSSDIVPPSYYSSELADSFIKNRMIARQEYGFLRDYRSPIFLRACINKFENIESVLEKLDNGFNQNNSTTNCDIYILINVIYLMYLFEKKQYLKIYKLITDNKYQVRNNDRTFAFNFNNFTANVLKSEKDLSFYTLNNIEYNFKEYEKTL